MKLSHVFAAAIIATGLAAALPACQSQMADIPGNAPLVASATGTCTYTAAHTGTIYIYDKSWNKLVYAGQVDAGQMIQIDTQNNRILVDNQPRVEQANVGGGSQFQFYLQPSPVVTTVERRTVIEQPTIERKTVTEREVP